MSELSFHKTKPTILIVPPGKGISEAEPVQADSFVVLAFDSHGEDENQISYAAESYLVCDADMAGQFLLIGLSAISGQLQTLDGRTCKLIGKAVEVALDTVCQGGLKTMSDIPQDA